MLPKIFIFDVGGTLLKNLHFQFEKGFEYLYNEVLDIHIPYEEFMKTVGQTNRDIKILSDQGYETSFESVVNYLIDIYGKKTNDDLVTMEDKFSKAIYGVAPMEGAKTFLEYLKEKKIPCYALSNTMFSTRDVKRELEEVGLLSYFEDVIASGDHLYRKPNPMLFQIYIKRFEMMGYKINELAYLGNDFVCDVETPVKLGMVSYFKGEKLAKHDGTMEFDTYENLIKELEKDE